MAETSGSPQSSRTPAMRRRPLCWLTGGTPPEWESWEDQKGLGLPLLSIWWPGTRHTSYAGHYWTSQSDLSFQPLQNFPASQIFQELSSISVNCRSLWLWIGCTLKFFISFFFCTEANPRNMSIDRDSPEKMEISLLWSWWRPVFIFIFSLSSKLQN